MEESSLSGVGADRTFRPEEGSLQHVTASTILRILAILVSSSRNLPDLPYILMFVVAEAT